MEFIHILIDKLLFDGPGIRIDSETNLSFFGILIGVILFAGLIRLLILGIINTYKD